MPLPSPTTVREQIAWSYANLARAEMALKGGAKRYEKIHDIVRGKLYSGLVSGRMSMSSLYDDERPREVDLASMSLAMHESRLRYCHCDTAKYLN